MKNKLLIFYLCVFTFNSCLMNDDSLYLIRGRKYMLSGLDDLAINDFTSAIKINSKSFNACKLI